MTQEGDCFPDFDHFVYTIAIRPTASKLTAWSKLEETERRLAMYKRAESKNDPRTPQNRVLLNDTVSAFLLTFEATFQFVKNQFETTPAAPNFDVWLESLPENDTTVRALRTLRHFEAHIESKPPPRLVNLTIRESLLGGTSQTEASATWKLPELGLADLAKLKHAPLKQVDLHAWNKIATGTDAPTIFERGLTNLRKILEIAEPFV